MHPVTRLGRVAQQVRSFATLHAGELDQLAREIEAAGLPDLAQRARTFRALHETEAQLVLDELSDLRGDLERQAAGPAEAISPPALSADAPASAGHPGPAPATSPAATSPAATATAAPVVPADPAAASPKRARWLAEQARRAAPQPLARRSLLVRPQRDARTP